MFYLKIDVVVTNSTAQLSSILIAIFNPKNIMIKLIRTCLSARGSILKKHN